MEPEQSLQHETRNEPSGRAAAEFIFPLLAVGSPLEELAATAERRMKMHRNLGEEEAAKRVSQAHELARARLEAVLSAPKSRLGS